MKMFLCVEKNKKKAELIHCETASSCENNVAMGKKKKSAHQVILYYNGQLMGVPVTVESAIFTFSIR